MYVYVSLYGGHKILRPEIDEDKREVGPSPKETPIHRLEVPIREEMRTVTFFYFILAPSLIIVYLISSNNTILALQHNQHPDCMRCKSPLLCTMWRARRVLLLVYICIRICVCMYGSERRSEFCRQEENIITSDSQLTYEATKTKHKKDTASKDVPLCADLGEIRSRRPTHHYTIDLMVAEVTSTGRYGRKLFVRCATKQDGL